jgi:hypothetical protein
MTDTHAPLTPLKIPRRANGIRRLAADMASRKISEVNARQSVSDRIGYAVSTLIGAAAFHYGGELAVGALVLLYAVSASVAYSRYLRFKHQ